MEKCRSKNCDQRFHVGWNFCPKCGKDNRPKEFRPSVEKCSHKFIGTKPFCTICGEDMHSSRTDAVDRRIGFSLVALGASCVIGSFALRYVAFEGEGLLFRWVNTWFDDAILLPGNIVIHGADVPRLALMCGILFASFGAVGLSMMRLRERDQRLAMATVPRKVRKAAPIIEVVGTADNFMTPMPELVGATGNSVLSVQADEPLNCPTCEYIVPPQEKNEEFVENILQPTFASILEEEYPAYAVAI